MKTMITKVAMLVIALMLVVFCSGCCGSNNATLKSISFGSDGPVGTVEELYRNEDGEFVKVSERAMTESEIVETMGYVAN